MINVPLGDLHPKQRIAYWSEATEILYGGAVGGAKSHLMRVAAISWCCMLPGLQVYLFRRLFDDLIKNHLDGPRGFRNLLAPAVDAKTVDIVEDEIRFHHVSEEGLALPMSQIYLCHCKDPKHVIKYQGAEIHVLLIDEITHFFEEMYRFLRHRARAPGLVVTEKFKQMFPGITFPRIVCSGNPGNVGHQFVRKTWIVSRIPYAIERVKPSEGGMLRQFIPARMEDNPTLLEDDPGYADRVEGLGSEELVRAMKEGDWDIVAGAYFDNIRRDKHELPRFTPPKHWTRFRAMDWGSYRPFSIGWYVIAEDEPVKIDGEERRFPKGALIRYREWYGCNEEKANTGLKLDVEDVADGILKRELHEKINEHACRADPSMWDEDGGPSLIERMWEHRPHWYKPKDKKQVVFHPADNKRIAGWQQMRARLNDEPETEQPMLYVTEDCTHWWRTVPAVQHDEHKVEDVDSDGEDHAADETRYACMARPISVNKPPKAPEGPAPWTIQWVIDQDEAAKRNQRR